MGDKLKYCQACLSSNRALFPLSTLGDCFQMNSLLELFSNQGDVCWECNHIIKKFSNFHQQVQRAQEVLCHSKVKNVYPLSKLSVQKIFADHYNFTYDPIVKENTQKEIINTDVLELEQNITVKEESEQGLDLENHSPNNDTYLDEESDNIDAKPYSETYVEILNEKRARKCTRVGKKSDKNVEDDAKEKFTTIVFTEEEMLKNREEKRNHPNFKKIPYKCESCVLGFTRKENYDVHLEKKHEESIGSHSCPVCLVRFKCPKQVARHKDRHYVCYRCKLCKYDTAEMWSVLNHVRTKHLEDCVESIHCGCCEFVAKTPEELSAHSASAHALHCLDCGARFKALTTLKAHIRRVHNVKREFICTLCSRPFSTRSRLETHVASHDASLARRLAYCAPCRVQYKNIHVYRNHLRTSANHAREAYECEQCNKKFASKVYWKKHYNFYHLHKSQFHCDICDKLFISDWRLKNHRQTQHGLTRSRDHRCADCGKQFFLFISDWRLKNHRQTQHGLTRSRDHRCADCGKQFFTLSTLKGHQLTHSEQRSFMCEDCGDTFKQRPALYTHARLVHRGLPRRKRHAAAT